MQFHDKPKQFSTQLITINTNPVSLSKRLQESLLPALYIWQIPA